MSFFLLQEFLVVCVIFQIKDDIFLPLSSELGQLGTEVLMQLNMSDSILCLIHCLMGNQ